LIGVAAGFALPRLSRRAIDIEEFRRQALRLRAARPTAVNLMHVVDRLCAVAASDGVEAVEHVALALYDEDVALCRAMAEHGADLIEDDAGILTHCNTGGLATAGWGTALAVIRLAHERGKNIHVYVDETRPLLQGGRLTAWELQRLGIPHTLICDNAAAAYMRAGRIHAAFVGADRIAANGDAANKIGTYTVAVTCRHHGIPFYVVAPRTTLDPACPHGATIPIEERDGDEIRGVDLACGRMRWAPATSPTGNPAFDVTPAELIDGWVLDDGIYRRERVAERGFSVD